VLAVWHRTSSPIAAEHHRALGALWIRVCVRHRIWEEWWKIGRRNPHDAGRRRDERNYLRKAAAELWS
jgi:hypothetical protein